MFPIPSFPPSPRLRHIIGWIAVALFLLGGVYSLAWGQQQYTSVDLGSAAANAIADNVTLIVGTSQNQAAILSAPQALLGTLPTTIEPVSVAFGASSAGVVGGSSIDGFGFHHHAFIW